MQHKPSQSRLPQQQPISPQSTIPAKLPAKKRPGKKKLWSRMGAILAVVATIIATLAAITAILSYLGITNVESLLNHPASTLTTHSAPIYIYHGHGDLVESLAWSPDSQRIVSSGEDGTVQIWNATTGENAHIQPLSAEDTGPQGPGGAVAWSPNGKYIAVTTPVEILLIDAATDTIVQRHVIHSDPYPEDIISSSWSPDGTSIVYSSYETIHIWNIMNGRDIRIYTNQDQGSIFDIVWSPNGKYIASTDNNLVHVWNPVDDSLDFTYKSQSNLIGSLAWSQNSQYIASIEYSTANDNAQKLEVWNAFDGYPYEISNASNYNFPNITCSHGIVAAGWSPNNTYLLYVCYGSSKKTVNVWDFPAHRLITLLTGSNTISDVKWSPNEEYLAIASDSTVQIWRLADLLRT